MAIGVHLVIVDDVQFSLFISTLNAGGENKQSIKLTFRNDRGPP